MHSRHMRCPSGAVGVGVAELVPAQWVLAAFCSPVVGPDEVFTDGDRFDVLGRTQADAAEVVEVVCVGSWPWEGEPTRWARTVLAEPVRGVQPLSRASFAGLIHWTSTAQPSPAAVRIRSPSSIVRLPGLYCPEDAEGRLEFFGGMPVRPGQATERVAQNSAPGSSVVRRGLTENRSPASVAALRACDALRAGAVRGFRRWRCNSGAAFTKWNRYSWLDLQRSFTDSGSEFHLFP